MTPGPCITDTSGKAEGRWGGEKLDHSAKEAEYGEEKSEAKEARGGFKNV